MLPKILGFIPEHSQYWEFFCGTCQVFKRKKPVPFILVDKNREIVSKSRLQGSYTYLHKCVFDVLRSLVDDGFYRVHGDFKIDLSVDAFVYMDPPWRISMRGGAKVLYEYDMSDNDLARLLLLARKLPVKTAILHYTDVLFDDILNDWNRFDFKVSFRGRVCDVSLYYNYDHSTAEPHLPEFSGLNRTDRQRIKRKAGNWVKMLAALPVYERRVILNELKKNFEV